MYGYDDLDCYAWRTSVYQEYDSYEQGWADNLQKTSEDWANPVRKPEQYTEVKYDEKFGETICMFFKKGHCKKGKNCNFAHEHQQVLPEGAIEGPKSWEEIWTEMPKGWQKVIEKKNQ